MIKKQSSVSPLISEFESQLQQGRFAAVNRKNKFLQAGVNNLVKAADLLDQVGHTVLAQQLTDILQKLAEIPSPEKIKAESDHMTKNLLEHGHVLDLTCVDDKKQDLSGAEIEDIEEILLGESYKYLQQHSDKNKIKQALDMEKYLNKANIGQILLSQKTPDPKSVAAAFYKNPQLKEISISVFKGDKSDFNKYWQEIESATKDIYYLGYLASIGKCSSPMARIIWDDNFDDYK